MSYQEEERTRLRSQSRKQAIALAMQGRWWEAVAVNKSLAESFPDDVDAYNRLGRAYMELGETSLAREAYGKALELNPYNVIAKKNLERLSRLGEAAVSPGSAFDKVEPQHFIEEVGKAGVVNLYRLATAAVLAKTVAGNRANLKVEGPNLIVESSRGEYLGQVGPRYAQRLIKLMAGGNDYSATVVSSTEEAVTVIIREVYQHPSQVGQLSFPPKGAESFRPYVGDRIIRRELEYEEALLGEPSYTVIDAEEGELAAEDFADDDEADNGDNEE